MLNLKERHIVVVLVLIAVTFLLFLSIRKPICITEGLTLNDTIYKIKSKNTDDLSFQDYQNSLYSSVDNVESCNGKKDLEKEVKPIVLSKNQINEYDMDKAEVLENKVDIKKISSNNEVTLKPKTNSINKKFIDSYSINSNVNPKSNVNIYNKFEMDIEPSDYGTNYSNINILDNDFNLLDNINSTGEESKSEESKSEESKSEESKSEEDVIKKTFKEIKENDDSHDKCVPIGYTDTKFNPYGLLRDELKSYEEIIYKKNKNLDENKCSTLKSAILDLNKTGYIENNNVERSWNGTFKETCGKW